MAGAIVDIVADGLLLEYFAEDLAFEGVIASRGTSGRLTVCEK